VNEKRSVTLHKTSVSSRQKAHSAAEAPAQFAISTPQQQGSPKLIAIEKEASIVPPVTHGGRGIKDPFPF